MLLTLVPIAQPVDAAELWLEEDFEDGPAGVFASMNGLSGTSIGHQGDGGRVSIPTGEHWGATGHWSTQSKLGYEPEEMWIRYWIQFPEGFRVDSPYRGKLPGFGGLYTYNCLGGRPSTSANPCWSARLAFQPVYPGDGLPSYPYDPSSVTRVSFYSYLLNSSEVGETGKIQHWDPDLSTLQHGRWYCLEARVKMNGLGQNNGVLQGFVDGSQAFSASNLTFRRASESHLKVKSFWFDVYYGGSGTSPKNNEIFFDSIASGPDRIGCNDQPQSSGRFYDDDDSIFENAIEQLAASGITRGCNPPTNDRFCPKDSVTRGQMAAFLKRALGDEIVVDLPEEPGSPPDFWGGRSYMNYRDALAIYAAGNAQLQTYMVRYSIDATTGDKDWLRTGTTSTPTYWVPIQLGRIWDAGATPYIQLTVEDLPGLVSGRHDARLNKILDTLGGFVDQGGGRRLLLDILPDANSKYKDYGDDPSRFKSAFRRVAQMARAELGAEVRVVFSAQRAMKSNRYSTTEYGAGGFSLFWPGSDHVDVAGLSGFPTSGGDDASYHRAGIDELANVIGPAIPIMITSGGAPSVPNEQAQIEYAEALAKLAVDHPQVVGVQWNDRISGNLDLTVAYPSGVQAGFAAATSSARSSGLDWLFSSAVDPWASAREAANPFDDSTSSVFRNSIKWLAATGITQGCGYRKFCPNDKVTRGQMAAFLSRALGLAAPHTPIEFSDTKGHIFENAVSRLAYARITLGCNPPGNSKFCPDRYVTREQMAAFMVRGGLTD